MQNQINHNRTIRVFISSTFRDMQEERDYLVKFVFPELRRRCRARQVEFVEVDLRWGITDKQAQRGETLPRCLEIINVCRPYFIGILGERYGWIPTKSEIPEKALHEQPWLKEHLKSSVTELEIMHGVLNNPEMEHRAFFYYRDPSYVKNIPSSLRKDYLESNPKYRERLKTLKSRIKSGGFPVHDGYPDIKTLGRFVLEDLWAAIEEEYPPPSMPTDIERLTLEHESFARNRCVLHTPRETWERQFDEHIEKNNVPLLLIGESGMGKSAMLAHWALRYAEQHSDAFVLMHFVGVSPESARPVDIQRRIITELNHFFSLGMAIPDRDDEVAETFHNCLVNISGGGRIVLVIDALNQLEVEQGSDRLHWLPETYPGNVSLILSSTLKPDAKAATLKGWRLARLNAPSQTERANMIAKYLEHYKRDMDESQIQRILSLSQTANPLFLRILLDELRMAADHATLKKHIKKCLRASGVAAIFDLVLKRWEKDFNTERESLVQDALRHLVISRRGLSEREFLELLGERENNLPLPQAYWSPFYLAVQDYLINRSGYFWFFHDHLRQAVEKRYGQKPEARCAAMFSLADFYSEKISRDCEQGGTYRNLSLEIADEALKCAQKSRNQKLIAQAHLNCSGTLLSTGMGIGPENAEHFKRMVYMSQKGCRLARKADAWDVLADGLVRRAGDETLMNPEFGRYDLIDEAIALRRKHHAREALRDALRDKARIGMRLNQLDVTEACLKDADKVQARLKECDPQWPKIHRHQYWGECRALQGKWKQAVSYLENALKGAERFGHYDGINAATGWLGLAWYHLGEETRGMQMVRRAMETERDMLQSLEVVGRWLVELGKLFDGRGEFKRALEALWLAEMIYEELQHSALVRTRNVLKAVAAKNPTEYERLKKDFNPFDAEFAAYCSLWGLQPLKKAEANPILSPKGAKWESHAVFNPTAWTAGRKVYLLYRAEGVSPFSSRKITSSIGLAESKDGINFSRMGGPVLYPEAVYEIPGGCEDPRLVYIKNEKTFILTYTAYDGKTARLAMATTRDHSLRSWERKGPVFNDAQWKKAYAAAKYADLPPGWSKSGAIYSQKVNGYYWMFFGDTDIRVACSRDLQSWDILEKPLLYPRKGFFDSELVEPGPPPVLTNDGLLMIYNSARKMDDGTLRYACGQALLDPMAPTRVLRRSFKPILEPELPDEIKGQTPNTVFASGLILFKKRWHLYYGMADLKIGVAVVQGKKELICAHVKKTTK